RGPGGGGEWLAGWAGAERGAGHRGTGGRAARAGQARRHRGGCRVRLRAWTPWAAAVLASAAVPGAGCGTRAAWSKDESERIEQIIRPEKFSENLPGV